MRWFVYPLPEHVISLIYFENQVSQGAAAKDIIIAGFQISTFLCFIPTSHLPFQYSPFTLHHFLLSFLLLFPCTDCNVFSQEAVNFFSFLLLSISLFLLKHTSKYSHFSFLYLINHSLQFNNTTVGIPFAAQKLPHSPRLLHKNKFATADACSLSRSSSQQSQTEHFHWYLKGARLQSYLFFNFKF